MAMKPKTMVKVLVDWLMFTLLMVQMGRHLWGNTAHEWTGAGMFVLFILHQVLNLDWYRRVLKGRYSPVRILGLIVNALVLAAMTGMIISGVTLSQQVFSFLPIKGGTAFARLLHMVSTYWGFVIIGLHLGLHWQIVMELHWKKVLGAVLGKISGMVPDMRRKPKTKKTARAAAVRSFLLNITGMAIAVYGLYAFLDRGLLTYMFLQNQFVFLDYGESRIFFYLDHLGMTGLFVWAAHNAAKFLKKGWAFKKKLEIEISETLTGNMINPQEEK